MKTFLAVFNIFPAVLGAVAAVESAVPVQGAGQHKLNLILGAALSAWEVSQQQQLLSKDTTLNAIQAMVNLSVAALNAADVFKTTAPVSSK